MKYTNDIIQEVLALYKLGYSSRNISLELFGTKTRKSSVNDIINRYGRALNEPYSVQKGEPKILLLDLETSPTIAAVFGRYDINLSQANIIREGGFLFSAAWKFLGDKEVTGVVMTPEEVSCSDDSRIVANLYEVIQIADIVVGHNLNRFDIKVFRTRCLLNNFPPPKTVKTADTLTMAKRLKFDSNKLDSLGSVLGVGRKIENSGMSLWVKCLEGNEEALQEMLRYNKQDVALLQDVYLKLRAFDTKHPNLNVFYDDGEDRCTVCGSLHIHPTGHSVFTQHSEYAEYACGDCGSRSKLKTRIKTGVNVLTV